MHPKSSDAFSSAEDALAAAVQLDESGQWDASVAMFRAIADRWPEQARYCDATIREIRQKQDLAAAGSCDWASGPLPGSSGPSVRRHPYFDGINKALKVLVGLFVAGIFWLCLKAQNGPHMGEMPFLVVWIAIGVPSMLLIAAGIIGVRTVRCPLCRRKLRSVRDEDRDTWVAECRECDVLWDLMWSIHSGD